MALIFFLPWNFTRWSFSYNSFVKLSLAGLTLPLAIVAICYQKYRVATNISHWLKVNSRWFKNYISAKMCIFISFWIFQFLHTLLYCAIFNSLNSGFFLYHQGVTVWIQNRPDILSGLIWVQTVCKGYQLIAGKELNTVQLVAKTLAKINFIWFQLFQFG